MVLDGKGSQHHATKLQDLQLDAASAYSFLRGGTLRIMMKQCAAQRKLLLDSDKEEDEAISLAPLEM